MNWKMHHQSNLFLNWLDFIIEWMETKKKPKGKAQNKIPKTKEKESKVIGKKWKRSESESLKDVPVKRRKDSDSSEY